ncbi:MAG: polysaccharide deacetylase family protein [Methylomonas sp.]
MSSLPIQHFPKYPVPVSHKRNLIWWLLLIAAVITGHELPKLLASTGIRTPPVVTRIENQAFLALSFGKVSNNLGLAISVNSLKEDLNAIKQAGYNTLSLAQINRWRTNNNESLPSNPVLLTFEQANRETIEIVDPVLARLGMTATVFVDVAELEQANIHLASWHQLELMAKSGRWEVAVSACPNGDDQGFANPVLLAQKLSQQRQRLEQRLQTPVLVADCSRAWNPAYGDGAVIWSQTLREAGFAMGFVAAASGANYHEDNASNLKRIRVSRTWLPAELVSQLNNNQPRRVEFVDQFDTALSASAWIVDSGELNIEPGNLRLSNSPNQQGALISLAGTEKWRDADVEVQLAALPIGQFWLSLRHDTHHPSIRLGIANGQVLLQESLATDVHRQLASVDMGEGALTLRLRVVGKGAMAYLNGQPLTNRPVAMPEGAEQGAMSLAVWQPASETADLIEAVVNLSKVSAKPLETKVGIMNPVLDETGWQQLHDSVDQLAVLSPQYFAWQDGKPQVLAAYDNALAIFARYHQLSFQPTVIVDRQTQLSEASLLAAQLINWASEPGFDGLNLVLNDAMLDDGWRAFLTDLIQRIRQTGKTLIVTVLDVNQSFQSRDANHFLLVASPSSIN